jgi:hypothetical protein
MGSWKEGKGSDTELASLMTSCSNDVHSNGKMRVLPVFDGSGSIQLKLSSLDRVEDVPERDATVLRQQLQWRIHADTDRMDLTP